MTREMGIALGAIGVLLVGGGIAYAASGSKATAAGGAPAGGGALTPGEGVGPGSPVGLTASGKTATGWEQRITLPDNQTGMEYLAFFGDRIVISLPAGAHWRANVASQGPATGTDAYSFTLASEGSVTVTWTDVSNTDKTTILHFVYGAVFNAAAALEAGDYVMLAIAQADIQTVGIQLATLAQSPSIANPVLQEQVNAILAVQAQLASQHATLTPAQSFALVLTLGPWAEAFGFDVQGYAVFAPGTTMPSWWPADDTAAATEYHALYRYVGPGVSVSALPFPVKAWKRGA